MLPTAKRTPDSLTDEEIEDCIEGSSDIDMIREILTKAYVINDQGFVEKDIFANWFATGIEGFIDADPDTEEFDEAWQANHEWALNIAANINDLLA
jgi:hypothetical protein